MRNPAEPAHEGNAHVGGGADITQVHQLCNQLLAIMGIFEINLRPSSHLIDVLLVCSDARQIQQG